MAKKKQIITKTKITEADGFREKQVAEARCLRSEGTSLVVHLPKDMNDQWKDYQYDRDLGQLSPEKRLAIILDNFKNIPGVEQVLYNSQMEPPFYIEGGKEIEWSTP